MHSDPKLRLIWSSWYYHLRLHILLRNVKDVQVLQEDIWGFSFDEGQVEGLSYNFMILLVSSPLSTLRAEISRWHLLHLLLLCLNHPVFLRGHCYAHVSKLKENAVVNTVLFSSFALSQTLIVSPPPLPPSTFAQKWGPSPSKAKPVARIWAESFTRKIWIFLGVNKQ